MNIFVLHKNPIMAAQAHCDKHVTKMILESAQMLSTVLDGPYRPTHKNHPCTKWVAESRQNARWLWQLAGALDIEYRWRYRKEFHHKSWLVMLELDSKIKTLPNVGLTPFALAMPDEYKNADPVTAYRAYYRSKAFAEWRNGAPDWW